MKKKAQLAFIFAFIVIGIIIILIFGLFAPALTDFSSAIFSAGDMLLQDAQENIAGIADETVRNQVNESMQSGRDATQTNIEVTSAMFQYAWVFFILILAIGFILYTRRQVEFGGTV